MDNLTFNVLYKATLERLFYGETTANIINDICENGRVSFKETVLIVERAKENLNKFMNDMGDGEAPNHFNHPCL